jgi:aryl-alcohol dehydrogenase-like predicted oxidoreductase
MELGVNWIDTAAVYGLGHSEEVVGMALKKLPKRLILATKCSLVWDSAKKVSGRLKKESVRPEIDASELMRLIFTKCTGRTRIQILKKAGVPWLTW